MLLNIFLLIFGFAILIKGADFFIDGASALGVRLGIPQIIIGLTVIAFGTSLPELFVNINSSIQQNNDLVLGNILGSNIFNILIIVGLSALISPITAQKSTSNTEIPYVIVSAFILYVLASDELFGESYNSVSRGDGIILIVFMLYFLNYIYKLSKKDKSIHDMVDQMPVKKIILFIGLGFVGLILGSQWIVDSAVYIATDLGISQKIIAITKLVTQTKQRHLLAGEINRRNIVPKLFPVGLDLAEIPSGDAEDNFVVVCKIQLGYVCDITHVNDIYPKTLLNTISDALGIAFVTAKKQTNLSHDNLGIQGKWG